MPTRLRKLIGTIAIIVLVIIYAMLATTVAVATLAFSLWYIHFAYFLISGLLWILPTMLIIKWMEGPIKKK